METFILSAHSDPDGNIRTRQLYVHDKSRCEASGFPCVIHNPSDHHMRGWELNWRDDMGCMERFCPHGIGHPDPDHIAWTERNDQDIARWHGIHGCDGCCRKDKDA